MGDDLTDRNAAPAASERKALADEVSNRLPMETTMSNMSYCRFNNTLSDLRDCEDHMLDCLSKERGGDAYDSEHSKRRQLIECCIRIAQEYGVKDDDGVLTGEVEDMTQYEEEEEHEG
jgi:hypothetical protein